MSWALNRVRLCTSQLGYIDRLRARRRGELVDAIVTALEEGERPTDVAEASPYTAAYVRTLAREAGVPPRIIRGKGK